MEHYKRLLLCAQKTIHMHTSDWCDAEGPSAGSLGTSGIFKVVSMVQSQVWDIVGCRGEVRVLLSKPESTMTLNCQKHQNALG